MESDHSAAQEVYYFGPYKIEKNEVFFTTDLSFALVNLRPVVPGSRSSYSIISSRIYPDLLPWKSCHAGWGIPQREWNPGGWVNTQSTSPVNQCSDALKQLFNTLRANLVHFVCSVGLVKRFADLTAEETSDLWLSAQKIGSKLESHLKASSLTFAIQDGPDAGQTVPHVHIHILPRKGGDFEKMDEVYDVIDVKEKELKEKLDLDKERKDRTTDEMAEEADEFRALF